MLAEGGITKGRGDDGGGAGGGGLLGVEPKFLQKYHRAAALPALLPLLSSFAMLEHYQLNCFDILNYQHD